MANEFANFSTLDDESSMGIFLQWAGGPLGGALNLRGGDRATSQAFPETEVKAEEETPSKPDPTAQASVPLGQHEISNASYQRERSSRTPALDWDEGTAEPSPGPGSGAVKESSILGLDQTSTPASPQIVSIAHRKPGENNEPLSRKAASANKLDEESTPKNMTPTQTKLLEKAGVNTKSGRPDEDTDVGLTTEAQLQGHAPSVKIDEHLHSQSPAAPNLTNVTPAKRDATRQYNPMSFFEKKMSVFFEDSAAQEEAQMPKNTVNSQFATSDIVGDSRTQSNTAFNASAKEFRSKIETEDLQYTTTNEAVPTRAEDQREEEPTGTAPQNTDWTTHDEVPIEVDSSIGIKAAPEEDDLSSMDEEPEADTRSEGGMDLTPVLNVLGARSVTSPTPSTVAADQSTLKEPPTSPKLAQTTAERSEQDNRESTFAPSEVNYEILESVGPSPTVPTLRTEVQETVDEGPFQMPETAVKVHQQSASRTIILKNLPSYADFTFVQSLLHGVIVESIHLDEAAHTARVKVTAAEDCRRYVQTHVAGIRSSHRHTIRVEGSDEDDVRGERMQACLDCGATRAVAVDGVHDDINTRTLFDFAGGLTSIPQREVESVVDTFRQCGRVVIFRFTNIQDAVDFRSHLLRDKEWRSKNPYFAEDPCESATSPRIDGR